MITLWLHYYINTVDIFEKNTLKSELVQGNLSLLRQKQLEDTGKPGDVKTGQQGDVQRDSKVMFNGMGGRKQYSIELDREEQMLHNMLHNMLRT